VARRVLPNQQAAGPRFLIYLSAALASIAEFATPESMSG